jgi:glycosyltransferase involved in cell wall biosynthesis
VIDQVAAEVPDVVHLHGLSFPRHAARLVRRLGRTPLVAQDHADRPARVPLRPLHRRAWRDLAGLMITSRAQADPFFAAGVLGRSVPVFEVIESSTRFTSGPTGGHEGALEGRPSLAWTGRLDANKDPLAVLEAFARAARLLPDARLYMCWTDAPLLPAVQARVAADPELRRRVALLGRQSPADVERLLRGADLFVQGSRREGSGYAVIEALACGATPVVTDIPPLRRLTRDAAVGALAAPGDVDAMSRAIVRFGARDRSALRAAARAHFERHLSIPALGRELRGAYEAVAHGRSVRRSSPRTGGMDA